MSDETTIPCIHSSQLKEMKTTRLMHRNDDSVVSLDHAKYTISSHYDEVRRRKWWTIVVIMVTVVIIVIVIVFDVVIIIIVVVVV